MSDISFTAVDWGTTSFRLWVIDKDGGVVAASSGPFGMLGLAPAEFEPVLERSLSDLEVGQDVPVIICGMAGAAQGWCEAPYLHAPTSLAGLGRKAVRVPTTKRDARILPGVMQPRPANVMRGEETQILGFLRTHDTQDGIFCLPGTHTKWVRVEAGKIAEFTTCMTGEIFGLLSEASVLRHSIVADSWDVPAFQAAVTEACGEPETVATSLFGLRAGGLVGDLKTETVRSRLSGLLTGAELAATRVFWEGAEVHLIGDASLCRNYRLALGTQQIAAQISDGEAMTLSGLKAAFEAMEG